MKRTLARLWLSGLAGLTTAACFAQSSPQPSPPASDDLFELLAPLVSETPEPAAAPQFEGGTVLRFAQPAAAAPDASPTQQPKLELQEPATSLPSLGTPKVVPTSIDQSGTLRSTLLAQPLLDNESLMLLAAAAAACEKDLDNVEHGEHWQSYLRLPQIQEQFGSNAAPTIGQASAERKLAWLKALHQRYETLQSDSAYQLVTDRETFKQAHSALGRCLMSPAQRQQQLALATGIQELATALDPVPTGAKWQAFFELGLLAKFANSPRPLSEQEQSQLKAVQSRFEQAASGDEFKTVSQLPGFATTHLAIREMSGVAKATPLPQNVASETNQPEPLQVRVVAREADITSPEPSPHEFRLVSLQGLSFAQASPNDRWTVLSPGQSLNGGSSLKTSEKGFATVSIGKQTAATITPNSTVRLVGDDAKVRLEIVSGGLRLATAAAAQLEASTSAPTSSRRSSLPIGLTLTYGAYEITPTAHPLQLEFTSDRTTGAETSAVIVTQGAVEVRNVETGEKLAVAGGRAATMIDAKMKLQPTGD